MGRRSTGWRLGQNAPTHAYFVRFWHGGREYKRSTGTRDPVAAGKEAARIYADVVQREPERPRERRPVGAARFEELIAAWLVSLQGSLDPRTIECYEDYAWSHWEPHFGAIHHVTDGMCVEYARLRLGKVRASTVRKELSALRRFGAWLFERGALPRELMVPSIPKRAQGTPYAKDGKPVKRRTAAPELAPEQTEKLIALLPEWSRSKKVNRFPIRARFLVQYDAGLRSEVLDVLSVPEHWAKGQTYIELPPEDDKSGVGRRIYLRARTVKALAKVAPKRGLIFGRHNYRRHIALAASKALPPRLASRFTAVHLRSAAATHWLDDGAPLTAVQHQLGHKHTSTTARYIRPSERAAKGWFATR